MDRRVVVGGFLLLAAIVVVVFTLVIAKESTQPTASWAAEYCGTIKSLKATIANRETGLAQGATSFSDTGKRVRDMSPASGTQDYQSAVADALETAGRSLSGSGSDRSSAELAIADNKIREAKLRMPSDAQAAVSAIKDCEF